MRFKRLLSMAVGVALAGSVWVAPAGADPVLNFDQTVVDGEDSLAGGTVSYAGDDAPLVGTDIGFDRVTGSDTPQNAGETLFCDDPTNPSGDRCFLNFTTGDHDQSVANIDIFEGGGTFILTGNLYTSLGVLVASGTLIQGFWEDVSASHGALGLVTVEGTGFDTKHEDLVAFYGLGPNFVYANTEITMTGCSNGVGNAFNCEVVNADIANFAIPIPEPGALLLLGMGLLGLGGMARRRLQTRKR